MDKDKKVHTFLAAQTFACQSSYYEIEDDIKGSVCEVADEFSANNFKPSPNGTFALQLKTEGLNRTRIAKLRIDFEGTFVYASRWILFSNFQFT